MECTRGGGVCSKIDRPARRSAGFEKKPEASTSVWKTWHIWATNGHHHSDTFPDRASSRSGYRDFSPAALANQAKEKGEGGEGRERKGVAARRNDLYSD